MGSLSKARGMEPSSVYSLPLSPLPPPLPLNPLPAGSMCRPLTSAPPPPPSPLLLAPSSRSASSSAPQPIICREYVPLPDLDTREALVFLEMASADADLDVDDISMLAK